MSDFSVPVVKIGKLEKLPNSDKLSITEVEGCPVICQTSEFKEGDLAVYIPVEAVVPLNRPCFDFLKDTNHPERETARIKAKRLRGTFSMGLLIPVDAALGKGKFAAGADWDGSGPVDVAADLGIVKYEEPELQPTEPRANKKGSFWRLVQAWVRHPIKMFRRRLQEKEDREAQRDPGFMPVYDMESIRKHKGTFAQGEQVYVSEKIHGCNARYSFRDNRFWVGSHRSFKKKDPNSWWWRAAIANDLEKKLQNFPGLVVYGEIYGRVQDLNYGCKGEEIRLAVFDLYDSTKKCFLSYAEFETMCALLSLPRVPVLYVGPYGDNVALMAEGNTTMPGASHIREGIVIKPVVEREARGVGRVILKLIGPQYLLRKGGTEAH